MLTEQEYEKALGRIWELMDAETEAEIAELEHLGDLVEEYEERHFPMDKSLGEALLEVAISVSNLVDHIIGLVLPKKGKTNQPDPPK